jgi:hypothetical protein
MAKGGEGAGRPGAGAEAWFGFSPPGRPLDAPLSGRERARLLDILRRAAEPDGLGPAFQTALGGYLAALGGPTLHASGVLRSARALLKAWAEPDPEVPEPVVSPVADLSPARPVFWAELLELPPTDVTEPAAPPFRMGPGHPIR